MLDVTEAECLHPIPSVQGNTFADEVVTVGDGSSTEEDTQGPPQGIDPATVIPRHLVGKTYLTKFDQTDPMASINTWLKTCERSLSSFGYPKGTWGNVVLAEISPTEYLDVERQGIEVKDWKRVKEYLCAAFPEPDEATVTAQLAKMTQRPDETVRELYRRMWGIAHRVHDDPDKITMFCSREFVRRCGVR